MIRKFRGVVRRTPDLWSRIRQLIVHGGTLCQILLYPCFFIGGLYMVVTSVPNVVAEQMGSHFHQVWSWLLVVGPLLTLLSWRLRRSEQFADSAPKLGLAGNIGLTFALAAYVAASMQAAWIGKGLFAVWAFVGLTLLVAVISFRDGLRMRDARRLTRKLRS